MSLKGHPNQAFKRSILSLSENLKYPKFVKCEFFISVSVPGKGTARTVTQSGFSADSTKLGECLTKEKAISLAGFDNRN